MKNYGALLWLLVIGACSLAQAVEIRETNIHESLSPEELLSIFHVDTYDKVPAYEVIKLHSRVKRNANQSDDVRTVHLNAFNQERVLNLRRNEHIARNVPVFYAEHDERRGKVVVTPAPEGKSVGEPYQDEETLAAVMLSKDPVTGDVLVDGTVGEDLVVRPVPRSVLDVIRSKSQKEALQWRREEEQDLNAIRPPDDEAFLDEPKANVHAGDLVFSDGFPLVADDGTRSGRQPQVRVPYKKTAKTKDDAKKLPEGLELIRRRRSAEPSGAVHIVYKRKPTSTSSDYMELDLDRIPARSPEARHRSKRAAPAVIYPEILVLVDYDGYLLHGQDNSKIKSYYVSFWNGADLRYKLLRDPKVKISIAGIIISRSRDAMPYLERNRVDRDAIDSASALTDMGKYLFQERRLPTYDIAVAITKLDMCRRAYEAASCNRGTAGFAYVGGACVVNKRLKKVSSVAIVEDTGGFSGIIVAAHEVGHLLGAVHDGAPPPSYLGGPGAKHCRWEDGYIMSDLRHTEKGFRWSRCSVDQFHHFLNGDTATCLYNLPHEDESLPRILPGKLLSLDQQCRKDRGTSACFKDERVCAQLFCFDSSSGYCVSYRPAAEGSDCGGGKICLNGRCVYDNENTISDHDFLGYTT